MVQKSGVRCASQRQDAGKHRYGEPAIEQLILFQKINQPLRGKDGLGEDKIGAGAHFALQVLDLCRLISRVKVELGIVGGG